jgi:hypothetical protein
MPLTAKQKKLPKALQDKIMGKHKKPMKKQTKQDRLDEAEGKKKGKKKKKQGVSARLDEAEGKKKAKRETKIIRKRKTY